MDKNTHNHRYMNLTLCVFIYVFLKYSIFCRLTFKFVLETLLKYIQDLWVTSISHHTCPEGLPQSFLTCCLNCPPATLRVAPLADRVYGKHTGSNEASQCFFPTDGPPVKYFYHQNNLRSWVLSSWDCERTIPWSSASHECKQCGLNVGEFLTKTLLIRKSGKLHRIVYYIMATFITYMFNT